MNQLLTDFQFEFASVINDNWTYEKYAMSGCWFRGGEYASDHLSVSIHKQEVK